MPSARSALFRMDSLNCFILSSGFDVACRNIILNIILNFKVIGKHVTQRKAEFLQIDERLN